MGHGMANKVVGHLWPSEPVWLSGHHSQWNPAARKVPLHPPCLQRPWLSLRNGCPSGMAVPLEWLLRRALFSLFPLQPGIGCARDRLPSAAQTAFYLLSAWQLQRVESQQNQSEGPVASGGCGGESRDGVGEWGKRASRPRPADGVICVLRCPWSCLVQLRAVLNPTFKFCVSNVREGLLV